MKRMKIGMFGRIFLPASNRLGCGVLFLIFAGFGFLYYLTARALLETKGKSLEEIERHWEK